MLKTKTWERGSNYDGVEIYYNVKVEANVLMVKNKYGTFNEMPEESDKSEHEVYRSGRTPVWGATPR